MAYALYELILFGSTAHRDTLQPEILKSTVNFKIIYFEVTLKTKGVSLNITLSEQYYVLITFK